VATGPRRWCLVRVLLKHGQRRRRVGGGAVEDSGFFPFYSGRGVGGGRVACDYGGETAGGNGLDTIDGKAA
jgi:hypothetical protein